MCNLGFFVGQLEHVCCGYCDNHPGVFHEAVKPKNENAFNYICDMFLILEPHVQLCMH